GALRRSYTTGGPAQSSPAVANGVVYVGSGDKKLYALDAATGALRWSYTTGDAVTSSPAVASGVVYVGSRDRKVYALDAATGALRWSYTTGGMVDSSPTVANGVVYVGSWDNKLYALNAASGALGWSYTTGGLVWSSPAVANGVVYVGSYDSKVYAFEGQPPPVSVSAASYVALASFPISWTVPSTWTGTSASSYDVQYRDGASGAWTDLLTSTTSTSTTFSGQEGHTYSFRARSRTGTGSLGDWSEPVSTTVDLTAPTGSIAAQGWSSPYISNTVTLSVSASDSTSGLSQMQLGSDGLTFGAWETYTTTRSHVAPPGAAAVYGRFKDGAGNISQPVTGSITLDASPPAGSVQAQGWSSPYISNTVTLSVSASDGTSGLSQMQFGPNSETFNPWESYGTASLYLAPPGATAVFGRFKDQAQNVSSPVSASLTLLDDVSPTGTISINAGAAYANSVTATLSLSATDNLSGVSAMAFSNDGSAWSDWPGFSTSNSWPLAQPRMACALFMPASKTPPRMSPSSTLTPSSWIRWPLREPSPSTAGPRTPTPRR
ncbi:MAG: PQQ-binding-like beta-propeller repeat protein, partial [Chloroflexota bacterium]|nr:PQQ-binding-like beta-propeller repeat protein [Chloroflexota bacterium]